MDPFPDPENYYLDRSRIPPSQGGVRSFTLLLTQGGQQESPSRGPLNKRINPSKEKVYGDSPLPFKRIESLDRFVTLQ